MIEEVTRTNTELTVSLYRQKHFMDERAALEKQSDDLIIENRELRLANQEFEMKLKTQKMLFDQYKEFVRQNIDVFDFDKYSGSLFDDPVSDEISQTSLSYAVPLKQQKRSIKENPTVSKSESKHNLVLP